MVMDVTDSATWTDHRGDPDDMGQTARQAEAPEAARALQRQLPQAQLSEAERAHFANWRDTSDAGLLQEVLKVLAPAGTGEKSQQLCKP